MLAITGSNGFVGSFFLQHLAENGVPATRIERGMAPPAGASAVIHIGGLAHSNATPQEFMDANYHATMKLAQEALDRGVGRFVFVSTINVVAGHENTVLAPDLPYKPLSEYGISKARAEEELRALQGMDVVILRPPLVFGPNVKGNLRTLMKICATGMPLPFGSVNNRRSMIGVSNLCEAMRFLATAPAEAVAGRVFHVAEAQPFALSRIIATCRKAMGKPPRLFSLPPALLDATLRRLGKAKLADQLFQDLVVDDSSLVDAGWARMNTSLKDMESMARS